MNVRFLLPVAAAVTMIAAPAMASTHHKTHPTKVAKPAKPAKPVKATKNTKAPKKAN